MKYYLSKNNLLIILMDKKKHDYEIEQFWFGFKNSMNNFYNYYNNINKRPIDLWSNELNLLQEEKKYLDIELKIRDYISLYGIDVMRAMNNYYFDILKTNIKRWNRISKNYNFLKKEIKKYYNIIFLLVDIFYNLENKMPKEEFNKIYSEIELFIINNNFNYLIDQSIKYGMCKVLDKINNYINIFEYINKKYNINLINPCSGIKIISCIKNL
jgi:hypothetical protein